MRAVVLAPHDHFHVGIVVDDIGAFRDLLAETWGYEWGPDVRLEYTMQSPDGPITYDQRLVYSVTEPRLELVQAVAGTPLRPSSSGLHHLGYWCDDVAATTAGLVAAGWTWECGGTLPDGSPAWGYFAHAGAVRVELVSTVMRTGLESMWCPSAD